MDTDENIPSLNPRQNASSIKSRIGGRWSSGSDSGSAYFSRRAKSLSEAVVFGVIGSRGSPKWLEHQRSYNWEKVEKDRGRRADIQALYREKQRVKSFDVLSNASLPFLLQNILLVVLLGVVVAVMILIYDIGEHLTNVYYYDAAFNISKTLNGTSEADAWFVCLWMILGCAVSGAFCNFFVVNYYPECAGAGTDATRIAMAIGAPIRLKTAFARIFLSSIYLGMGNPLGMEAPVLHVTACSASFLLSCGVYLLPRHMHWEQLPTWVLLGVTAGLAAAFQAPLAGITYAIEEFMALRKVGLAVTLIGLAATTSNYTMVTYKPVLDRGVLHVDPFREYVIKPPERLGYAIPNIQALVMGMICCLVGFHFCHTVLEVRAFVKRQAKKRPSWKNAGCIGALVGCIGSIAYLTIDEGAVWGIGMSAFAKLLCIPFTEEYNGGVRKRVDIPYGQSLSDLENETAISPADFTIYFLCKYSAVIFATSAGGPGGVFYPSLLLGGYIGGMFACFCSWMDPAGAHDHRVCIYLGMVGLFTAINRTPLTSVLVTYEITGLGQKGLQATLTFPMIMTSLVSFVISECVQHDDFASLIMLQDGIDNHHLFLTGLEGLFAQKSKERKAQETGGQAKGNKKRQAAKKNDGEWRVENPFDMATTESGNDFFETGENTIDKQQDEEINFRSTIRAITVSHLAKQKSRSSIMGKLSSPKAFPGGLSAASAVADPEEEKKKQEENQKAVDKVFADFNAAQRILLTSASRALVTQEAVVGNRYHKLCEEGDVMGVHGNLLSDVRLDSLWIKDTWGDSVVSLFIAKEMENGVHMLLKYKCSPIMRSRNNSLPLVQAVETQQIGIIKRLLEYKAKVCHTELESKDNALHVAAKIGNADAMETLLTTGSVMFVIQALSAKNNDGELPLDVARSYNNTEMVSMIEQKRQQITSLSSNAYSGVDSSAYMRTGTGTETNTTGATWQYTSETSSDSDGS